MNPHTTALIMTIGLPGDQGGDVLDALILDIQAVKPEYLALIASTQSLPNARRMLGRSGLDTNQTEIVELKNANDLDEVFMKINLLIQRLASLGYTAEQIAINYTAGTKVMGSGTVLSAVYNRIHELRYITGMTAISDENPKPRHRILSTRPGSVFSYHGLLMGRSMMLEGHFRTAHDTLERLDTELLTREDRQLHKSLNRLSHAYEVWDNFEPGLFIKLYSSVEFNHESLEVFRLPEDQFNATGQLAGEFDKGRPGPFTMADILNNAYRRIDLGRNSDAVTRMYRALEMYAQWILDRDYGIDTNDVDTRKIPPRDRVSFEALRSIEDGIVRVGLRKAFDLLDILDARIGLAYRENRGLDQFIQDRSMSILAHGLQADKSEKLVEHLHSLVDLFRIEIPEINELTRLLEIPWMAGRHKL
jgi:CRISPR-associated protein (TIGR02710 family)